MDPASLALAIAGTIDLCFKYGDRLVQFCQEHRRIRNDIQEISLIIEGVWVKTKHQLEMLKEMLNSNLLVPVLAAHYLNTIKHLETKISGAVVGLGILDRRSLGLSGNRLPIDIKGVYLKRGLQDIVQDLEEWQRRFDPSWYLIALIRRPAVDSQLKCQTETPDSPASKLAALRRAISGVPSETNNNESVFKDSAMLHNERCHIPYTGAYTSRSRDRSRELLLDCTNHSKTNDTKRFPGVTIKSQIRDLARVLSNVNSTRSGLLKCEGVIEVVHDQFHPNPHFQFVLEIPDGLYNPISLRSLLLQNNKYSLSDRVQLAKQLTRSVMFVHTAGFVHKGIRPETILLFNQRRSMNTENDSLSFNSSPFVSFLIGFEKIRRAEAWTDFLGDLEWERNIYRHPVRQGLWAEEAFTMQHDIYSLGVCLLEIALWKSFVQFREEFSFPLSRLDIESAISDKDARRGGFAVKRRLIAIAREKLPHKIGDRYKDLVIACLCCLDESEDNIFHTGSQVRDSDGIVIGVRYIEHVS
ncbi:hypothetical protein PENSTE_c024G02379 [Penicillium steckii]|uniref:Protein kinase domain-containing protein n=1 Tax=Penicillium steckii TaxID=303698 RepID=A0A1V6SR06_9EURO|nr:hypothetical protein PENSTE_c024G02379 [Penicillium steckii]